jgi:hypothetical protein
MTIASQSGIMESGNKENQLQLLHVPLLPWTLHLIATQVNQMVYYK